MVMMNKFEDLKQNGSKIVLENNVEDGIVESVHLEDLVLFGGD